MTDEQLLQLPEEARKRISELQELIPDWQKVKLTKQGYNAQYVNTLINVAIYVLEREKQAIAGVML